MTTINQLVKKGRKDAVKKSKSPALQFIKNSLKGNKQIPMEGGCPQKR